MIAHTCITSAVVANVAPGTTLLDLIGGTSVSPPAIANFYGIPNNQGANVKVGIISLGGGWKPSDLQQSMSELGLPQPNIVQVNVETVANIFSTNDSNFSLENTLDLYCVASMVPKANIVLYMGNASVISFAKVINRAIDDDCDVISISWAADESDLIGLYPGVTGAQFDQAFSFANAAARGITVLAASGDYGSTGNDPSGPVSVVYPASSPNVVAVGGTILNLSYNTESFSDRSGGGISSLFPVPEWQDGLSYNKFFSANNYSGPTVTLTSGALSSVTGNVQGRGVPDISAPFANYPLYFNGTILSAFGTSASTPVLAGMFARYISITGRRPIPSALHSILYSNPDSYGDIVLGWNSYTLNEGYETSNNWDPVTGLGSPNGNSVYKLVSSGGTKVKGRDNLAVTDNWDYVANVRVKTATNTWSNVKAIWTKTVSGWKQTY